MNLKPCPFCGGKCEIELIAETAYRIGCINCDMVDKKMLFVNRSDAVGAWNQRPSEEKLEKLMRMAVNELKNVSLVSGVLEFAHCDILEKMETIAKIISYAKAWNSRMEGGE